MKNHTVEIELLECMWYSKTITVELTSKELKEIQTKDTLTWELENKFNVEIYGDENFDCCEKYHNIKVID